MTRASTVALLVAGAVCTAASQVRHPALASFTEALATLGYLLAAVAKAETLMPRKDPPA